MRGVPGIVSVQINVFDPHMEVRTNGERVNCKALLDQG